MSASTPLSPARRRLQLVLLTLAALAALLVLGASVAVYLARGAILSKAEAMAAGLGLTIEIREVDVPLMGGIGLRGVDVRSADGTPVAHFDRIETDVSLVGAALGKRRPGNIELVGGTLRVRWNDGPVDLKRSASQTGDSEGGTTEPLTLSLRGVTVSIEARQTTALGVVACEPVRLEGVDAALARDATRQLRVQASGTFVAGSHRTKVALELDQATNKLVFVAEEGIELGLETPYGPTWVALNAASHEAGKPFQASGIGVRQGDKLVQLHEVTLRGGGDGFLPALALIEGVDVRGLSAQRGADRTTIATAALAVVQGPTGLVPTHVALTAVEGRAERDGRQLSGGIGVLEVGFDDLLGHLARGTPLDAITSLKLERPAATLVIAASTETAVKPREEPPGKDGKDGKDAKPLEPAPPLEDDLPPFVGNDDDLPPPESVVPALAPGHDWLGALLGSDHGDGADAGDLIPPDIAAKLPQLLARIRALAPKISDGSLAVVDSNGKSLLSLQEAGFSAARQDDGTAFELRAAVLREGKEAGRADLRVVIGSVPGAPTNLRIDALEGTLSGRSLAHQVARFVSGLSVQEDAEVDLRIRYERPRSDNAPHHVEGTLRLASFSFEYWRIADREIRDLEATVTFDASIDRTAHRLLLLLPDIQVGQARLSASLDLTRTKQHLPSFVARLEMPRQDCGKAAASIPKGLIPNLPTLALRGQMSFKASLTLDLENPRGLDLEVLSDADDCQILSLGPAIDIEALRGPFIHHPREPKRGVLEHIAVGRGTTEWIPSERIPDIVKAAAWVTEDRRWLEHGGVRWDLVERALKIDLEHGRFIYGGSTITQQLVKNLYLTRDKNLARKLEEAIIAWQMERTLRKDEILTTYINCIEYGPDIYGIKQAARLYFGKKPSELDALESAFIMGLKPYPRAGYNQFLKQTLDVWWVRRVSHVLRYMAKFAPDQITLEEAEAFAPFQPTFRDP